MKRKCIIYNFELYGNPAYSTSPSVLWGMSIDEYSKILQHSFTLRTPKLNFSFCSIAYLSKQCKHCNPRVLKIILALSILNHYRL